MNIQIDPMWIESINFIRSPQKLRNLGFKETDWVLSIRIKNEVYRYLQSFGLMTRPQMLILVTNIDDYRSISRVLTWVITRSRFGNDDAIKEILDITNPRIDISEDNLALIKLSV